MFSLHAGVYYTFLKAMIKRLYHYPKADKRNRRSQNISASLGMAL
jgi:hypothetical protein